MQKFRRAVVLAAGSGGDVAPMAAIAARLAERGLETTLLAPQRYRHFVGGAAVAFASIGADDVFDEVFDSAVIWDPAKGLAASWRYYGAAMRSGLLRIRQNWHAADTLLISSTFAVAARLAEEVDGFRNTTVHLSPAVMFSACRPPRWPAASIPRHWPVWLKRLAVAGAERFATDPVIGAQINPFRKELGLPPARHLFSSWLHARRRVVYAFPAWFAAAAEDWPAQGVHAGFPDAGASDEKLPGMLDAFLDSAAGPVVVITAGTAVATRPAWVERCKEFAIAQGGRVVIVEPSGSGGEHERNVCRISFAPFRQLLPRAQLIIHHAGIGTMAEAMRAGLPQLLVPTAHDQPDNAVRIQDLGLGRVLNTAADHASLAKAWQWAMADSTAHQPLLEAGARMATDGDGAARIADIVLADARM